MLLFSTKVHAVEGKPDRTARLTTRAGQQQQCDSVANLADPLKKDVCCDTDPADDPFVPGTVYYGSAGGTVQKTSDYCWKGKALRQVQCDGKKVVEKDPPELCAFTCDYDLGACVAPTCHDADASQVDPLAIGSTSTLTLGGVVLDEKADTCLPGMPQLINEAMCAKSAGDVVLQPHLCPGDTTCQLDDQGYAYCKSPVAPPTCTDLNPTPDLSDNKGVVVTLNGVTQVIDNFCLSDPIGQPLLSLFPDFADAPETVVIDLICQDLDGDGVDELPGLPQAKECPKDHQCQNGKCEKITVNQTCTDTEAAAVTAGAAVKIDDPHFAGTVTITLNDVPLPTTTDFCDDLNEAILWEVQCNEDNSGMAIPEKIACNFDEYCSAGKCLPLPLCADLNKSPFGVDSLECPIGHMIRANELTGTDANGNGIDDGCEFPQLVSVGNGGAIADGEVLHMAVNFDGRYVAFDSKATNLLPSDPNADYDVFLRDRKLHSTTHVSKPLGSDLNKKSFVSHNATDACGAVIAFGTNRAMVPEDGDIKWDSYLYVRETGAIKLLSAKPPVPSSFTLVWDEGTEGHVSTNGKQVAYYYQANINVNTANPGPWPKVNGIYRYHVETGVSELALNTGKLAVGSLPSMSGDGQVIAFEQHYSEMLFPGDGNNERQVLEVDSSTPTPALVSHTPVFKPGNGYSAEAVISASGTTVLFWSQASDIVPYVKMPAWNSTALFIKNLTSGKLEHLSFDLGSATMTSGGVKQSCCVNLDMSDNGRWVVYDVHGSTLASYGAYAGDMLIHDRVTKESKFMSAGSYVGVGLPYTLGHNPRLSGDGRWVVFSSYSNDLTAEDTNFVRNIYITYNPLWTQDAE